MERTSQRRVPLVLIAIAVVLLALRIGSRLMEPPSKDESLVRWVPISEAVSLSQSENKPMLFDFTAEWCPPCHILDAEVFRNPALAQEINERFIPVRVVDRQQEEGRNRPDVAELQQRYTVSAFPTVVIADASGTQLARMEGFRGRAGFERMMAQALSR